MLHATLMMAALLEQAVDIFRILSLYWLISLAIALHQALHSCGILATSRMHKFF